MLPKEAKSTNLVLMFSTMPPRSKTITNTSDCFCNYNIIII